METKKLEFNYTLEETDSPFWAFAIHNGHQIDDRLETFLAIDENARLREEDPYTGIMAELPFNRFIASTSRFQLDINRKIEDALYLRPDQAWGLHVWKNNLPSYLIDELYSAYNQIYQLINRQIERTIERYGFFVVYDIHSYNAKRQDPLEKIDTGKNPQINLGTAYNHEKWNVLTQKIIQSLQQQGTNDQPIDVRENIKFKGGYLSQHINRSYGDKGCVLSFEFRKDFMDEWAGQAYPDKLQWCKQLLLGTVESLNNYFSDEQH